MGDISSVEEGVRRQWLQAGVLVSKQDNRLAGEGGTLLTETWRSMCRGALAGGLEGVQKAPVSLAGIGTGEAILGSDFSGSSSISSELFLVSSAEFPLIGEVIVSASILSQLLPGFNFWKHFGVFDSGLYKRMFKSD